MIIWFNPFGYLFLIMNIMLARELNWPFCTVELCLLVIYNAMY